MLAVLPSIPSTPSAPPAPRLGDLPTPEPKAGEVLVRVHACALNRADLLQERKAL